MTLLDALLPESKLVFSPVVVNSRMNRERKASGINSYEKEIKFKPEDFLLEKIKQQGFVKWLDVCCGKGNALIQCALFLEQNNLQQHALLHGIDLVDFFAPVPDYVSCIKFDVDSITKRLFHEQYDLITCIHGLHYIGDKLHVIEKLIHSLNHDGLFIANLDTKNILIDNQAFLHELFKKTGVHYNRRRKIISCSGSAKIQFNFNYLGADDTAGANYTGQEVVNAYYSSK